MSEVTKRRPPDITHAEIAAYWSLTLGSPDDRVPWADVPADTKKLVYSVMRKIWPEPGVQVPTVRVDGSVALFSTEEVLQVLMYGPPPDD